MSSNSWNQTLISAQIAGSALTAAAAASALPPAAKFTFPANQLKIGDILHVRATGIISCVVTTPGTARFDLRFGSTVIFDSGAMNLNVIAKTNVPWWLEVLLTCRSIGAGTSATFWGQGQWQSEAVIGSPLPSAGGNGSLNIPVSGVAISTGFDSTVSNVIDSFFTQTVATGSMTLEQFELMYDL
ncbi:MAG: hypothetical protein ACRD3Q_00345 [Terriglobales bacterium]